MPKGIARARLLPLLAVLFTLILGTSGRAQNPNSKFPFAAGGGYAVDGLGFVHFAFSAMLSGGGPTPRGHGRFDFRDGTSDQGDVICFDFSPTSARFIIDVTKGVHNFLLVEVVDGGGVDTLAYQAYAVAPVCSIPPASLPGPVAYGNIVVSDGQ
jgi:hypothetical protein